MEASVRQQLEDIVARENLKGIIVYPPTLSWNYLQQRPQQMLKSAAKQGYLSVFCTPNANEVGEKALKRIDENLYLCKDLDELNGMRDVILYITWVLHEKERSRFPNPTIWYDVIDDLSLFWGDRSHLKDDMLNADSILTKEASIISASADVLFAKKRKQRSDIILVENGVTLEDFNKNVSYNEIPFDIKKVKAEGKPIIGYWGVFAEWFDYKLVLDLASQRPEWNIVLIGMDYDRSFQHYHSQLSSHSNIHLLGRKEYNDLYKYAQCFDVGIIPFMDNEIIKATSPIKMFEYMAAGLPTVTSAFPEAQKYGVVQKATSVDDFIQEIERGITQRRDSSWREQLLATAGTATWNERFKKVDGALSAKKTRRSLNVIYPPRYYPSFDLDYTHLMKTILENKPLSVITRVTPDTLPYLEEAVMSILRQEGNHWNLCIVYDGDPLKDGIVDQLNLSINRIINNVNCNGKEKQQDIYKKVKLVVTGDRKGPGAALNLGITTTHSDVITILDGDDTLCQHYALRMMYTKFKEGERRYPLIYSDFNQYYDHGRTVPIKGLPFDPDKLTGRYKDVAGENQIGHLRMFSRKLWQAVGGFREDLLAIEDVDFFLRAYQHCQSGGQSFNHIEPTFTDRLKGEDTTLVNHRVRSGSNSRGGSISTEGQITLYDRLLCEYGFKKEIFSQRIC